MGSQNNEIWLGDQKASMTTWYQPWKIKSTSLLIWTNQNSWFRELYYHQLLLQKKSAPQEPLSFLGQKPRSHSWFLPSPHPLQANHQLYFQNWSWLCWLLSTSVAALLVQTTGISHLDCCFLTGFPSSMLAHPSEQAEWRVFIKTTPCYLVKILQWLPSTSWSKIQTSYHGPQEPVCPSPATSHSYSPFSKHMSHFPVPHMLQAHSSFVDFACNVLIVSSSLWSRSWLKCYLLIEFSYTYFKLEL